MKKSPLKSFLLTDFILVDPSQNLEQKGHLWIQDGKIHALPKTSELSQIKKKENVQAIISGHGRLLCTPSFIDMHVHLREPGQSHKETISSGTKAALAGGFTRVLTMANTNPVIDTKIMVDWLNHQIKNHAYCEVYTAGAVSQGLQGKELTDFLALKEAGISALSDDGASIMSSSLMRRALEWARDLDLMIIVHAEDTDLNGSGCLNEGPASCRHGLPGRPAASEAILVSRDVTLAELVKGARLHFAHISSLQSLRHLQYAQAQGLPITSEVTPHHLSLTEDSLVHSLDTHLKMAPPLRSQQDCLALIKALNDKLIDVVATDHAPHSPLEKSQSFSVAPLGILGLETAWSIGYQLVKNKQISLMRLVEAMSTNPAQILRLDSGAGTLKEGAAAHVTLLDPTQSWTYEDSFSKSRNSPYWQMLLPCPVVATFLNGQLAYSNDPSWMKGALL